MPCPWKCGWGPEQPGLVKGVCDIPRGLELDSVKSSFQTKAFSDCTSQNAWQQTMSYVYIHVPGLKKTSLKNTTRDIIAVAYSLYEEFVTVSEILVLFPN